MEKEWWEGVGDGSRLLIAPAPSPTAGAAAAAAAGINGCLLSLRHPKSGNATNYLLSNDNEGSVLQELHWFKQSYTSWFLGDYVSRDGSLYTATPVDPVFILLPIFEEARMKKRNDLGKFRQLDEIIFINDYPGYQHLMSIAENCMRVVCEIKEIGSSMFFRLNDSMVLAWLYCKVFQLKKALCSLDNNYAAQDEKYTLAEAVSILGEYVKDEPWLMLLALNLLEVTSKVPEAENFLTNTEHNPVSSTLLQEKGRSADKTKRIGKQAKKAKVETESRNIREMLSRACRKS
uniref:Ribonuclease H2 subunit B n=1 Tax=Salix viminalis TaxID=40686 RepID=A0A6N2NK14_SALVM